MRLIGRKGAGEFEVEVTRGASGYRVRIDDRWIEADFVHLGPYVYSLRLEDGRQFTLVHHQEGDRHEISLGGGAVHVEMVDPMAARRAGRSEEFGAEGHVRALMPGRVVRVLAAVGDHVTRGAGLLILEAMKMENEIQSPCDGVVEEYFVKPGQTVEAGADLVKVG